MQALRTQAIEAVPAGRGGTGFLPVESWNGAVQGTERTTRIRAVRDSRDDDGGSGGAEQRGRVLLAESDERVCGALARLLEGQGYDVAVAHDAAALLAGVEREHPGVVLVDVDIAERDPAGIVSAIRARDGAARLIALSGSRTSDCAGRARTLGLSDVLPRPLSTDRLLQAVARAARAHEDLRGRIIGETPVMQRLFASIMKVAPLNTSVLISGETGTGKELVARSIHALSERAAKPFVPVHCAALPETLLESELFGHVRGSFTSAVATRAGLLEEAQGGTLFLDEMSTLSPAVQVKLLRVLQERTIQRVGSNQLIPVDFRLVGASNVDLAAEVRAGRFREDLFYRIHVFPLRVPPLRERAADIPLLVEHFRRRFAEANQLEPSAIPQESLLRMMAHDWPGNIRELENAVESMLVAHLGAPTASFEPPSNGGDAALRLMAEADGSGWDLARLEREYILTVLEQVRGRRGEAAERLGIDRRTLDRKLKAYRLALDCVPGEAGAG